MIFIDTGAFLARYLPADQHHKQAITLWEKIHSTRASCTTSNFVLDEMLTLLARRASYSFAAKTAHLIYASRTLQILRPDLSIEHQALNFFEKFADQEVSFTDCISFALMQDAGIRTTFTFDTHFEHAGFRTWK